MYDLHITMTSVIVYACHARLWRCFCFSRTEFSVFITLNSRIIRPIVSTNDCIETLVQSAISSIVPNLDHIIRIRIILGVRSDETLFFVFKRAVTQESLKRFLYRQIPGLTRYITVFLV